MGQGTVKAGQTAYPEWLFPWLPSKYLNFIWVISAFRYIFQNYIRHCETQQLQNLNKNLKFHLIALFVIILAK